MSNVPSDFETNLEHVDNDLNETITESASYVNITTGTVIVKNAPGRLISAIVNSHSSGTLRIIDAAADTSMIPMICNTISFAAGERQINFHGLKFGTGCLVNVGGTINLTLLYN